MPNTISRRQLLSLVGKAAGDIVDVVAPNGTRSYEIMAVRYV